MNQASEWTGRPLELPNLADTVLGEGSVPIAQSAASHLQVVARAIPPSVLMVLIRSPSCVSPTLLSGAPPNPYTHHRFVTR